MEVKYILRYESRVFSEDLPKIDASWRREIKKAIESKLTALPLLYGKPLRQSLNSYWKLRVGDYRIIYRVEKKTVKIFSIGHRGTVYPAVAKRLNV